MRRSTDTSDAPGTAVVVFESAMLQRIREAMRGLGLRVEAFADVHRGMEYVQHPQSSISVVVACATLPGVMNGVDLTTTLSHAYPTLPFVLVDHYEGLVENNVMCVDKPWTLEQVEEHVLAMIAKLPLGKRPAVEPTN
ncbi:response regulator [Pseudomonas sp. LP_7_YM]|uniref:response regulator n=1 Tax=Pseudomonas sp. LP_7_YM TaxID=2485137 RepID=UPI00105C8261|nr:response regulator [Pseudomonas sp. LP_7_YM]TDV71879.1 response regulator receiver domain-containing protein [Pseudomonas sp. LP_7_YM]